MLRRTSYPSSHGRQFFLSPLNIITTKRWFTFPPPNNNNNTSSTSASSFESADDVRLETISNFMAQKNDPKQNHHREEELVILVDATALLYRTAYNWAAVMAGKGALEADPTSFLQSRLPRILQFCHSVIPHGDGSEHQPNLLPPEVAMAAAELRFLTPIGGPWFSVAQLASSDALHAKKKQTSDEMEVEKKEERKSSKSNNNNNRKQKTEDQDAAGDKEEQQHSGANENPSTSSNRPILFAETSSSPGFFKRRVIFCFDHGSRSYLRSQFISNYKGQRSRCGRLSSFVGYASALSRQLETCGLIQGTFPALEWAPVLHDHKHHLNGDEKFQAITNRFFSNNDENKTENKNSDYHYSLSSSAQEKFPQDVVMQSLFDGATRFGPQGTATAAEGDDILHTCVKYFSEVEKVPTVVITHDKDLLQLLEFPKTYFFHLKQNKFVSRSETCELFGLSSPKNLTDYLSLVGDAVDNVPGLPGTGHHLALAILKKFGTIENLVQAAFDNLKKAKTSSSNQEESSSATKKKSRGKKSSAQQQEEKILEEPIVDLKLTDSSFTKTGKIRQISSVYLKNFFPLVREHADRLLQNKHKVIGLYQVPSVENFLKETYGKNGNKDDNNNNDPVVISKKISDPLVFPTIPTHFFTPGVFRRNMHLSNNNNEKENNNKLHHERKHSSLPNEGMFKAVRDYYIKEIGPCDDSNEKVHHCGDMFGSNSASSKKMRAFEKSKQEKNQKIQEKEKQQLEMQLENEDNEGGNKMTKRAYKKKNPNAKSFRGVVAVKPTKIMDKNKKKNQKLRQEKQEIELEVEGEENEGGKSYESVKKMIAKKAKQEKIRHDKQEIELEIENEENEGGKSCDPVKRTIAKKAKLNKNKQEKHEIELEIENEENEGGKSARSVKKTIATKAQQNKHEQEKQEIELEIESEENEGGKSRDPVRRTIVKKAKQSKNKHDKQELELEIENEESEGGKSCDSVGKTIAKKATLNKNKQQKQEKSN